MGTTKTVTTTKGGKTTSVTTTNDRKGAAWIPNPDKKKAAKEPWVRPAQPGPDYAWDDNKGWVSKEAAATGTTDAYSLTLAVIEHDKTLSELFNRAWQDQVKGQTWSKEEFTTQLKSTDWYKSRSESQRKYFVLYNDETQKVEFDKQVNQKKDSILVLAHDIGASLSDSDAFNIANEALRDGYDDSSLKKIISSYVSYKGKSIEENIGSLTGSAGNAEDTLRKAARDYGVQVSDSWILGEAQKASASTDPAQSALDSKDYIIQQAKLNYPQWADKIDSSRSLDFLSSGFKQTIADELNVDYQSLDMSNPYLANAMKAKDANNQPISQDALRTTLMGTDDWAKVSKNKDKIVNIGNDILSKFGLR